MQAKAWSTLDWLSGGRATAVVAVGWLKEEFDLLGVPFHERGAMTDEYVQAMLALWTQEKPEFEGKYVSFRDVGYEPKPQNLRSEEHTSELQSLMRISYAVFCLKKKNTTT